MGDYLIGIRVHLETFNRLKETYFKASAYTFDSYLTSGWNELQGVFPEHVRLVSDGHDILFGVFLQTTYEAMNNEQDIDTLLTEINLARLYASTALVKAGILDEPKLTFFRI